MRNMYNGVIVLILIVRDYLTEKEIKSNFRLQILVQY